MFKKLFQKSFSQVTLSSAALLSFLLLGCAGGDKLQSRTEQCQADFKESKKLMLGEDYFDAREALHDLLANCTGTGFMEEGQFLLAESYFLGEEWIEAYSEYNIFINHYPSSPQAPLATYKKGLSAWSHDYVPGRDETYTNDAVKAFDEFVKVFPEHIKKDSAVFYLNQLSERLADREMATAILYLKMREPQATAIYLQQFIKNFPDSERYGEALALLVESYTRLDQFEQADTYLSEMDSKLKGQPLANRINGLREELKEKRENHMLLIEEERADKLKKMEERR